MVENKIKIIVIRHMAKKYITLMKIKNITL